jgi:hypothetical protein
MRTKSLFTQMGFLALITAVGLFTVSISFAAEPQPASGSNGSTQSCERSHAYTPNMSH